MHATLAFLFLLGGGATKIPYAEFDGVNGRGLDPDYADIIVMGVDDHMEMGASVVRLTPGFHRLHLASAAEAKVGRGRVHVLTVGIQAEPCTQYSFAARRTSHVSESSWEPVEQGIRKLPRCTSDLPPASGQQPNGANNSSKPTPLRGAA